MWVAYDKLIRIVLMFQGVRPFIKFKKNSTWLDTTREAEAEAFVQLLRQISRLIDASWVSVYAEKF